MAKYYVLENAPSGKRWAEREGTKLKNDYGLDLFIEKRNVSEVPGRVMFAWVVTEARTGMKIGEGSLRKLAIANYIDKIKYNHGIDNVKRIIDKTLDTFGISPLYTEETKLPIRPLKKEDE